MTRAFSSRSGTFALLGAFALVSAAGTACSDGSEPSNPSSAGSASAGAPQGGAPQGGKAGSAAIAGSPPASAGSNAVAGNGVGGSGGSGGSSGAGSPSAGLGGTQSTAGSAGAPSAGQSPGGSAGSGTVAGMGGSAGASGGSPGGGTSGSAGASPSGGASGSAGSSSGGGNSGPDIDCPTGASFCSGFEGTALPAGTKFHAVGPNSPDPYTFDTAQKFAGQKSLSIPMSSGGFYYRALAVPVPGQNFWVRLYMRVSRAFGDNGHDSVFGASTGNIDADVNNEALVELSEQFDQVLLNTDDALSQPAMKTTLAADKWHCMEAHYDGASGNVVVYADGKEIINAAGYAKRTFQSFRIGYMQYHDTRAVWFDDVIVAPARINCK